MVRTGAASLALYLLTSASASAVTITFTASDLSDVNPAEDLWEYTYTVAGFTFDAGYGFSIFFDHTLYSMLQSPPPAANSDWDVITLQPDSNLPAEGLYDALSLTNDASLTDPFRVSFVWLGGGAPGIQPFLIYDPGFATIDNGMTVPEPSACYLILVGLLAIARTPVWIRELLTHHRSF